MGIDSSLIEFILADTVYYCRQVIIQVWLSPPTTIFCNLFIERDYMMKMHDENEITFNSLFEYQNV